jgi:hypothetical protein
MLTRVKSNSYLNDPKPLLLQPRQFQIARLLPPMVRYVWITATLVSVQFAGQKTTTGT